MKKLTYLVIATAALGMVACTGNKAGYVITGTVEGAADGDTVYLQEATGRNLTKLDTAVISKGTFTFEGDTGFCSKPLCHLRSERRTSDD